MDKIPFQYGSLAEADNFVNRVEERRQLKRFLLDGINVMLISPRRWGKSSLVKKAMLELLEERKDVRVCFLDAFSIHSEREFYSAFANAVIQGAASTLVKKIEDAKKVIESLVPSVNLKQDPFNQVSFDLKFQFSEKDRMEILQLPEKIATERGLRVIVCIDEFQQLANLKEYKSIEGKMRAVWQHHHNTVYCLYGSKRHKMLDIFNNSQHPFYRFGQLMFINKIAREEWIPYIVKGFSSTGKSISEEIAGQICDIVECHSWYVQQLSYFVWAATEGEAKEETLAKQTNTLIDTNAPMFMSDIDNLSGPQVNMLRAVAAGATQLNSKETIARFDLGGPQTITRNKRILQEKDFLEKRNGILEFSDPVFRLWILRENDHG